MPDVDVSIALPAERGIIQNLMQLYVHDFSEQWAGTDRGEIGDDGRFEDYPLDPYWRESEHIPLLIRLGGRIAGFALLNATFHSGLAADRNMAEFFVVRKHRRNGVGKIVAHKIFSRFPGAWEAAVAARNLGALAFWRNAVRQHPHAEQIEEIAASGQGWNGPILRFTIRS